jgi:toxin ParE1/3/4
MKIAIAPRAQRDLAEAIDFIARDNPRAAERVRQQLLDVFGRLATGELQGREITLAGGRPARRWPVPPYVIYYRRSQSTIEIARVYHQARRPIER